MKVSILTATTFRWIKETLITLVISIVVLAVTLTKIPLMFRVLLISRQTCKKINISPKKTGNLPKILVFLKNTQITSIFHPQLTRSPSVLATLTILTNPSQVLTTSQLTTLKLLTKRNQVPSLCILQILFNNFKARSPYLLKPQKLSPSPTIPQIIR
jgi:hypothetical protein